MIYTAPGSRLPNGSASNAWRYSVAVTCDPYQGLGQPSRAQRSWGFESQSCWNAHPTGSESHQGSNICPQRSRNSTPESSNNSTRRVERFRCTQRAAGRARRAETRVCETTLLKGSDSASRKLGCAESPKHEIFQPFLFPAIRFPAFLALCSLLLPSKAITT